MESFSYLLSIIDKLFLAKRQIEVVLLNQSVAIWIPSPFSTT